MPKVSPFIRSGNAGEVSILMEGRTDWDKYPASMRRLKNFVPTPQGPIIRRSGTIFLKEADSRTVLHPYVRGAGDDAVCLAITGTGITAIGEGGELLSEAARSVEIEAVGRSGDGLIVVVVGEEFPIGSLVTISGFEEVATEPSSSDGFAWGELNALNADPTTHAPKRIVGKLATVTPAADGNYAYKLAAVMPDGISFSPVNKYMVEFPEGPPEDKSEPLRNIGYLYDFGTATAMLNFGGTTLDSAPIEAPAGSVFYHDHELNDVRTIQSVDTVFLFHPWRNPKRLTRVSDLDLSLTDFTPYDGPFAGHFFPGQLTVSNRNAGGTPPTATLTLSMAGTTFEFKEEDEESYLRLEDPDNSGTWGFVKISDYVSGTQVTVEDSTGGPAGVSDGDLSWMTNTTVVLNWEMAVWGDNLGWPSMGLFYDDRLVLTGSPGNPSFVAGSVTGDYRNFAPIADGGTVLADRAFAIQLLGRRFAEAQWIETDQRGIIIGTDSGEWVVKAPDTSSAIGPLNIRANLISRRGSADADSVVIDQQVLYIQRGRRELRELSYSFEADGYRTPSLSIFSSHLGGHNNFQELAFAAEPLNLVWVRQDNGQLAGVTYDKEQNVIGWHVHDVGGYIENICVIPSRNREQDLLFMVVKRTINGVNKRYIEMMAPFWDFGDTLRSSHYVDCGVRRHYPEKTRTITGLDHLEGETLSGLADGLPIRPRTVDNGELTLEWKAQDVVLGLPFTSELETSRLDVGAADGTSLGKEKRLHNITFLVWDSVLGETGVFREDNIPYDVAENVVWNPIEYEERFDVFPTVDWVDPVTGEHLSRLIDKTGAGETFDTNSITIEIELPYLYEKSVKVYYGLPDAELLAPPSLYTIALNYTDYSNFALTLSTDFVDLLNALSQEERRLVVVRNRFDDTLHLYSGQTKRTALPPGYHRRGTIFVRQTDPVPLNIVGIMPQMHTQDR